MHTYILSDAFVSLIRGNVSDLKKQSTPRHAVLKAKTTRHDLNCASIQRNRRRGRVNGEKPVHGFGTAKYEAWAKCPPPGRGMKPT